MTKVSDFDNYMNEIAPYEIACEWDNVGLIIGDKDANVKKCLIALDITQDVIDEAISEKVDLIITHHPILFSPQKKFLKDDFAYLLIANKINLISAHTNLDSAKDGLNDILCDLFEIKDTEILDSKTSLGRIGFLDKETSSVEFAKKVKEKLVCQYIKIMDSKKPIQKVAIMSGAGSDWTEQAIDKNCDAFITSEIKHHYFILAKKMGITLIDAGHFETENIMCDYVLKKFSEKFFETDIKIAKSNKILTKYI